MSVDPDLRLDERDVLSELAAAYLASERRGKGCEVFETEAKLPSLLKLAKTIIEMTPDELEEEPDEIFVGNVVRLVSGGPPMTVMEIKEHDNVLCRWLNENYGLSSALFRKPCLVKTVR